MMAKRSTTGRALLMSLMAMFLCFTMMLGTTFAWFTDNVSSARNTIQSGNLDAILEYSVMNADGSWTEYDTVGDTTAVFDKDALYEPGYTEVVKFKVTNKGSLAFKYNLKAVVYSEIPGKNVDNITFELSDHLYVGLCDASVSNRASAAAAAKNVLGSGFAMKTDASLLRGESEEFVLVLTMPTTVGNEANHIEGYQPKIELGISLFATQYVHESDSFDKDYDEDATYDDETTPGTPSTEDVTVTAADLANVDFTKDNATYKLSGTFNESVTISVNPGLTQTYDASGATFADGASVLVNAPGVAGNYDALDAERKGSVTISGFDVDMLNVLAYNNEQVTISGNTVKSMTVIGGNFALSIDGNTIDGDFGTYTDGENGSNKYGISLRITDYDLSITNNTITDTYSHSIGINGRTAEAGGVNWSDEDTANTITFSGNKITVNSTEETKRAALKIWSDATFAPASGTVNDAAKTLMATILADKTNVFTLQEGGEHTIFDIFGTKTSDVQ